MIETGLAEKRKQFLQLTQAESLVVKDFSDFKQEE